MFSVRSALRQNNTVSLRGLQSKLKSSRLSAIELLQTNLIHQFYLSHQGHSGRLGFPVSEVQFPGGQQAIRHFRGGSIMTTDDKVVGLLPTQEVNITFLGFRCNKKASSDQLSATDEPYFILTVDVGDGSPKTTTVGPIENVDTGTESSTVQFLIKGATPNPIGLKANVYEHDFGDPGETAKKLQAELVQLSQQGASLASASDAAGAADGPGIGPGAIATGVAGILSGPVGALLAGGIVAALGLGDDFVGQGALFLFNRPETVTTPPSVGKFQNNDFNASIDIHGGDEGDYTLFFDVDFQTNPVPMTS